MVFVLLGSGACALALEKPPRRVKPRRGETTVDLNNAIQRHAQWKFKFRTAIQTNEQMDAAAISKDKNCELGKWLHGEAKVLHGQCQSYAKCLAEHAAFHTAAGKVAVAVNAGRKEEAERMLAAGSAFSEASKRVAVALIELQNEMVH